MSTLSTKWVTLADLQPGDLIDATGEMVEGVQRLGPVVIVDFQNGTATAPLPADGMTQVVIEREEDDA